MCLSGPVDMLTYRQKTSLQLITTPPNSKTTFLLTSTLNFTSNSHSSTQQYLILPLRLGKLRLFLECEKVISLFDFKLCAMVVHFMETQKFVTETLLGNTLYPHSFCIYFSLWCSLSPLWMQQDFLAAASASDVNNTLDFAHVKWWR